MTFFNDMYSLAIHGDYDGFMTGIWLVGLYLSAAVLFSCNFINKRR